MATTTTASTGSPKLEPSESECTALGINNLPAINLLNIDEYISTAQSISTAPLKAKSKAKSPTQPEHGRPSSSSSDDASGGSASRSGNGARGSSPVLIGSSITAINVTALTQLFQSAPYSRLNLQAEFNYTPVAINNGVFNFWATCRIFDKLTNETVKEIPEASGVSWPNKKHAKESVAKRAMMWVNQPENLGARVAAVKEREKGNGMGGEDGINWVGQVVEYFQKVQISSPVYHFYDPNPGASVRAFSCTATFNASSLHPSLPATQVLGSQTLGFQSKKAAKSAAAKATMLWLQSQECLNNGRSGSVRTPPRPSKAAKISDKHPLAGQSISLPRTAGNRKIVSIIAAQLKYEVKYEPIADADSIGLYSMEVKVGRRWNANTLCFKISKVVTGKDAAKEEAAITVVKWFLQSELPRIGVGFWVEKEKKEEDEEEKEGEGEEGEEEEETVSDREEEKEKKESVGDRKDEEKDEGKGEPVSNGKGKEKDEGKEEPVGNGKGKENEDDED